MIKNLPKEKRNHMVLIGLGTAIVLAGLWYGVVSAQKRALAGIAQAITEKGDKYETGKRLIDSDGQVSHDLGQVSARLKTIERDMASGDMYSWIIQTVNTFLTTHDFRTGRRVEIPQFSREVAGHVGLLPKFPYQAATFNLRGTAYFHDFGRFVSELENTYPFLRVQNIELEPAGGGARGGGGANSVPVEPEKLAFKMEVVALVNSPGR